ncbi:hypothetical protein CEXT_641001 [Caerostris extrusa]|uniref:Uncharacterized protein n=1 Tax=Caerostris extrusa TaxID=172846 RepID=A0AAV4MV17_CAEEX|nr:hypothetical protein CEXT_641001 [Caerostris extrusa]
MRIKTSTDKMRLGEEQEQSESSGKAPELSKGNKGIAMLIEGLIYHHDKVFDETINQLALLIYQLVLLIPDSWGKLHTSWSLPVGIFLYHPTYSCKVKMPDESVSISAYSKQISTDTEI